MLTFRQLIGVIIPPLTYTVWAVTQRVSGAARNRMTGPIAFANALLKCSTGALLPAHAEYVAAVTATWRSTCQALCIATSTRRLGRRNRSLARTGIRSKDHAPPEPS